VIYAEAGLHIERHSTKYVVEVRQRLLVDIFTHLSPGVSLPGDQDLFQGTRTNVYGAPELGAALSAQVYWLNSVINNFQGRVKANAHQL
jgi:hypothetical protein